jgi:hypothetical protein
MDERHDPYAARNDSERDPTMAAEVAAAVAAQAQDMADEVARRVVLEEQSRRVMDRMIEEQIERLIIREGLLENQMRALVGPRDRQLQEQQQHLDALARSLLGPQKLLEEATAVVNPDPPTGRIARPKFDKPQADWTLPRIPPPGLDQ